MLAALIVGTTIGVMPVVVPLIVVFVLIVLTGLANASPHRRMMRERRQHAERTARSMRRMSRIRARTIRRMDEAERRWRP